MEAPSSETTTQAKHGLTLLHAICQSRIETKARRAASKPRRHPPRCSEPWREHGKHRDGPMAPCLSHRSLQGLGRRLVAVSLSLERKIYLSFSLFRLSTRVSIYLIGIYIIELQILQLSLLHILQLPAAYSAAGAVMVAGCEKPVRRNCPRLTWGICPGQT